jgi:hypothetical protein
VTLDPSWGVFLHSMIRAGFPVVAGVTAEVVGAVARKRVVRPVLDGGDLAELDGSKLTEGVTPGPFGIKVLRRAP